MSASKSILAWAACSIALGVFVLRTVIPSARNPYTVGFGTLYTESRVLLESPRELRRIYDDAWFQPRIDRALGRHVAEIAHAQPPTMSLMLAPLAWMPPAPARAVWILLSVLAWAGGLALLAATLGLPRLHGVPPAVWLAAAGTFYLPLIENLHRGQGYALLFFLLCLVVRALARTNGRRAALAGVPLGLMLVLKSAGLWLWPLLLATPRRRALLGAAAVALATVALFTPFVGWDIWPLYLRDGFRFLAEEPTNRSPAHQTVTSLASHLLPTLPALAKLLALLVVVGVLLASVRLQRLASPTPAERALTLGLFVSFIVPAAPIGEGYHYLLLWPAIVIAWWWAAHRRPRPRAWLALAICTALVCVPQRLYGAPALAEGWLALLAYPRVYGAFGLWAWHARALAREAA